MELSCIETTKCSLLLTSSHGFDLSSFVIKYSTPFTRKDGLSAAKFSLHLNFFWKCSNQGR